MSRYGFLEEKEIYDALNKLRNAFLAAKDGSEVDEIINSILTHDEKMKIGRRIIVAEGIISGISAEQIIRMLKVGANTIQHVSRLLDRYPTGFSLIQRRSKKVEEEYKNRKYREVGSSQLVFKKNEYTGFKRKDVRR